MYSIMKNSKSKSEHPFPVDWRNLINFKSRHLIMLAFISIMIYLPLNSLAHCDSYDGPLIKDAMKAIDKENVEYVYKWIEPEYEDEISRFFNKTVSLKSGDREIYKIVEKHFLETLVRLHREGEGEPFTGLKPAGSIPPLLIMADESLVSGNVEFLVNEIKIHLDELVNDKFSQAFALSKAKEENPEKGRAYVRTYVEYIHFIEAIHSTFEHSNHGH
jgi:hypothetical protein